MGECRRVIQLKDSCFLRELHMKTCPSYARILEHDTLVVSYFEFKHLTMTWPQPVRHDSVCLGWAIATQFISCQRFTHSPLKLRIYYLTEFHFGHAVPPALPSQRSPHFEVSCPPMPADHAKDVSREGAKPRREFSKRKFLRAFA